MTAPSSIATQLHVMLSLLRDRPESLEEQKAAFRVLMASIAEQEIYLQPGAEGLRVNESFLPRGIPGAAELGEILQSHHVGELKILPGIPAGPLLSFARALAAPRGAYPSVDHLLDQLDPATRAYVRIAPPGGRLPDRSSVTAARDFVAGDDLIGSMAANVSREVAQALGLHKSDRRRRDRAREPLELIRQSPADRDVPHWLNEVVDDGERLAQTGQWSELTQVILVLIDSEQRAGGLMGRVYGVALRRLLPRAALNQIAHLITVAEHRQGAVSVLRRVGAEGTEILLDRLAAAENIAERRAYYAALQQMTEGTQLLVNMLGHEEWYVVRNVADLCGDLRLEEAVPNLARQVQHADDRVRRSVVSALAKVGSGGAIEPLRQALRDPAPPVRLLAARVLDGWKFRGLAMTLAVLVDEETDPEVQREMLLALGRIGTPEALQALVRAAAPGRRLFGRKPLNIRLDAVAGLRLAGAASANALQGLLGDEDPEVRTAAQKALVEVTG